MKYAVGLTLEKTITQDSHLATVHGVRAGVRGGVDLHHFRIFLGDELLKPPNGTEDDLRRRFRDPGQSDDPVDGSRFEFVEAT